MKTIKLLVFGLILAFAGSAYSQISVNVHLGTPPAWGPAGYNDVRYYYLPDVEAYYDVHTSMFIYISGNQWVHRSYLPSRYRNYDLYHGYKVVMNDYRGNSPYTHFREHRMKYNKGYRGAEQRNVGERNNNNGRPQNAGRSYRTSERNQPQHMNQNQQKNKGNNGNGNGRNNSEGHDKDKKSGHGNGNH
jgi:hypothetical protein